MNAIQLKAAEYEAKLKDMQKLLAAHPDYRFTPTEFETFTALRDTVDGLGVELKQMRDTEATAQTTAAALKLLNTASIPPGAFGSETGQTSAPNTTAVPRDMGAALVKALETAGITAGNDKGTFQVGASLPLNGWGDLRAIARKALTPILVADTDLTTREYAPQIVAIGTQQPMVADLLAQGTMTTGSFTYPREVAWSSDATAVAEGAAKPEQDFSLEEVTAYARKVAVIVTMSDEALNDMPAFASYVNAKLPLAIEQKVDAAILTGAGAPDLIGILPTSGILTQARGTDKSQDAILKGLVKVMAEGFYQPDGVVLNPYNWQYLRLATTADGVYLWGPPSDSGPMRVWGQPVVTTTALTLNTGLVGAFKLGAQILWREGLRVESSNQTEDNFRKNLITIRAEVRLALVVSRPTAFCKVTGLQ